MTKTKEGLEHHGYVISRIGGYYYVSWLVNGRRERIQEKGRDKQFRLIENARAFVEKHARAQQAGKEAQRRYTVHGSQMDYIV